MAEVDLFQIVVSVSPASNCCGIWLKLYSTICVPGVDVKDQTTSNHGVSRGVTAEKVLTAPTRPPSTRTRSRRSSCVVGVNSRPVPPSGAYTAGPFDKLPDFRSPDRTSWAGVRMEITKMPSPLQPMQAHTARL